ncbi:hypothetical protein ACQ4PT_029127 [Festuca glaucescens]
MDAVCEECGDAGFRKLLLRCGKCKSAARHRYCLDAIIFDSVVDWSCSGCIPKHNEAIKSLEDVSNEMQLSNAQLGCSMINEPNVDNEKVTKARRPRTIRPRRKRKYHVDDSTKHFLSGDTSNLGQCGNKPHEERDSMDATSAQFCSGDAIDSCEVFVGDIPNHYDCEKEGEDIPNHYDCEKEGEDIPNHYASSELPLDHASEFEPNNLQKAMDGSELASKSAECTHLSNGRSCCLASAKYVEDIVPRGRKGDTFSVTNDVEGSLPMIGDKPCPTSASVEQAIGLSVNREKPEKLKAVKGFEQSVVASKFAPNCSKPIQGSELKTWSAGVLSPLVQHLDSWPMVPMQSSPSNELEDVAVQENSAERTRCLVDEQTNAPTMEKLKVSKPSMENECLDSNEGNSDKANRRSGEVLLSTKAKKMPRQTCGDREAFSNPEPAKGDQDARNLQHSAEKPSYLGVKKMFLSRVLQEEGINSELLPSKFVGPCESTKINPRKRKQSESYNPDRTKYQKVARSKDGRTALAASLRDSQNMPAEDNVSNDKVIGHSRKGKYKNLDKSWLANKASRDPRKRDMVTSVLQPSYLHGSSVDKSRACLENIDLTLQEPPLNNPQSSCEPKKRRRLYDLNSRSCDNDRHVRKKRQCIENAGKKQRRCLKKGKEASGSGNLNRRRSKNQKRSKDANKDENASIRNLDSGCAKSDVAQLASQTVVKEGYCGISRMPLISECIDTQHLDKPYWTGIMKIDKNYVPLAAHLSTKAGKKVKEHSRSLPPIIKVIKFSTSKTCPKHLEAPIPSADSIDLYFLCGDTRPNKELDQLVKHVADSGIIIEAIVGLAKLCLFPSCVLPEEYQTFQGKPYLWGVFKPRKDKTKRLAPDEQDCAAHITKQEHVQKQHVLDQQDKAQGEPLDQVTHPENQPLLDANEVGKETLSGNGLPLVDMRAVVSANISPADHVQPCSNPEAPPLKLCGFVMSRTPRSAELIQEMQKEGALLFAVQHVMTEPGLVV